MEFLSDEKYTTSNFESGQGLFLKFWIVSEPFLQFLPYYMTALPGSKEGISTSIPIGFNAGIAKNISKEKLDAAIMAVKYISSEYIQKEYFKKHELVSAIPSIYNDKEVCDVADCTLFKQMQPLNDPFFTLKGKGKGSYSENFRKYIFRIGEIFPCTIYGTTLVSFSITFNSFISFVPFTETLSSSP